jgi:hypothetical protein
MANWYPSRRILGSPAWLWVLLAVPLFLVANLPGPKGADLDDWSKLEEPSYRGAIALERIVVAREGDSFRFVRPSEENALKEDARYDRRKVPLWSVNVVLSNHEENFSCEASNILPGLFHRESRWTYALKSARVDYGWFWEQRMNGVDWKGDEENPFELPSEQVRRLKPLLVVELNRRHPMTKLGNRLEMMIDDGLEASSTSFGPQNALILLRWLAILMAVVGICSMFVQPSDVPALPKKMKAFFLDKLIACVRRWRKSGELFNRRSHRGPAR